MSEHISHGRGRPPREDVYTRLHVQINELWDRMGGLPSPVEAADIWRGIWFEEAHHSTETSRWNCRTYCSGTFSGPLSR